MQLYNFIQQDYAEPFSEFKLKASLMVNQALNGGTVPRVHGNGFLQLDLQPDWRLNIWDSSLPHQDVSTDIHNHLFSFHSRIIVGELSHWQYIVERNQNGKYSRYQAIKKDKTENTMLEKTDDAQYGANMTSYCVYAPSSQYTFNKLSYHRVINVNPNIPTATIMHKTGYLDNIEKIVQRSSVLCPVDTVPDNSFNRDEIDMGVMLDCISKTLKLI